MLQNVSGIGLDYATFKRQFDTIPELKQIVDRFDKTGIVLKTAEKPGETSAGQGQANLVSSAKRAAVKTLQQPG
jgi:hypothetical protein